MSDGMDQPIWRPDEERAAASHLVAWREALRKRYDIPGDDFAALHAWTVREPEAFWAEAWADAGVQTSAQHTAVLADAGMPPQRTPLPEGIAQMREVWFPGARFNLAQHMLRWRDDEPAIVAESEARPKREVVSYADLYDRVARLVRALAADGVGPGDRVAGFLPNIPETVVAMLATNALGAVWSSTSPDFGLQGVLDRFGQIEPKVLLTADGYSYNGQTYDSLERVAQLTERVPSVSRLVVVPFLNERPLDGAAVKLPGHTTLWADYLGEGPAPDPAFPHFAFDHPAAILYSSGTTGEPKCIVHSQGGILLKHHTEHRLHLDLEREDTLFYFTTCGWMMWNWLVSGLSQGALIVLYDGSPSYPTQHRLFQLADHVGVTVFGTSPKFLATCENLRLKPGARHDLEPLRAVLSTGSPLAPEQFHYIRDMIGSRPQPASIAGGTDLIGCFMLSNPISPVYAGELQGPALGMDIAAFGEGGKPVVGERGELVCRQPFPSMPVGFWRDPDGERYRAAYFGEFPGVWRHGDYITMTGHGGVVMHGRSDATLNPAGVRIGTAEIYRVVENLPGVEDSIVVSHRRGGEERVVLFVVLSEGRTLDAALESDIRQAIRHEASPRHVPAVIRQVSEVPVTINGKKVELAVQRILHGQDVTNRDALANPQALDQFAGLQV